MEIRVIDCDAIVGFVDYGTIDSEKNGGYSTKMRCKKCGAAWLAENYATGYDTCPKCGATGKKYVISVEQKGRLILCIPQQQKRIEKT